MFFLQFSRARCAYLLIALLLGIQLAVGQHPLVALHEEARSGWARKDYANYIRISSRILAYSQDPAVSLRRAIAMCAEGQKAESEAILESLVSRGLTYQIDTITVFRTGLGSEKLQFWQKSFQNNFLPKDNSDTAAILPDAGLIPEGITHDGNGGLLVGSLAQWKVLHIGSRGTGELVKKGQDGIWSVVGIRSFPAKNELWACSATEVDSLKGYSGLFCFDLRSGQLIRRFIVDNRDGQHFFNDLVITRRGDVFLTDSKAGKIFHYNRTLDSLTPFSDTFVYPNGITIDETERKLYIADARGLHVLTVDDRSSKPLAGSERTYTTGIDGLYFYKGSLLAIQDTGLKDDRIVRFPLQGDTLGKPSVLQAMRPDFNIPTTGTIVGGYFYYIANSQLRNLQPDMTLHDEKTLQQSVILRLKLD